MRRLIAAAEQPPRSPFCRERVLDASRARPHSVRRLPQCARERPHHRIPAARADAVVSRDDGIPDRRRRRARRRPRRCRGRRAAVDAAGPDLHAAGAVGQRRRALAARGCGDRHRAVRRRPAGRRARGVDRAAAADVVHPGRAPALDVHRHQARHPLARGDWRPLQVRRLALQLHDRLRHGARPRDRDGRHRRHRRDRHRDPRRGAHPELPEPVAGVGGRLVPPAREVRARAHQLRLVDRHPPALQRPERPRHDRRGGRRGAAARPAPREAARVPVRPARRSASSRATSFRTRSGPRSSSRACRWPKSST